MMGSNSAALCCVKDCHSCRCTESCAVLIGARELVTCFALTELNCSRGFPLCSESSQGSSLLSVDYPRDSPGDNLRCVTLHHSELG